MVTADEALGEIKDLCNMFGFDFSRHFMAENIKREISFMISNLCVNTLCSALKKGWIFRKDICFNLEDKKSIEYLKPFEEMTGCPLTIDIKINNEWIYKFGPVINKVKSPCDKKDIKHYKTTQYLPTKNHDQIEVVLKRSLGKGK